MSTNITIEELNRKRFNILNSVLVENNRIYFVEASLDSAAYSGVTYDHYFVKISNKKELTYIHDYLQKLLMKNIEPFTDVFQTEYILNNLEKSLVHDAKVMHTIGYGMTGTTLSYRIARRFQKSKPHNTYKINMGIISKNDNVITYNFGNA